MIFGAGGHGRVVADAAICTGAWATILASDRNVAVCLGELLPGVQLQSPDKLPPPDIPVHIAIGNNLARQEEADSWGHDRLVSVVHPSSSVSRFSSIGAGCFVGAGAVVGPGARLGPGVIVNHGAVIDHDVQAGGFSHIAPNAVLGGQVRIGMRVLIGASAIVLPLKVIGDDVTVGAGAVVNRDLLEPGVYVGVPARKIL